MLDPQADEDAMTVDSRTFESILVAGLWLPRYETSEVLVVDDVIFDRDIPLINSDEAAEKLKDGKIDELETINRKDKLRGYAVEREVYYDQDDDEMTAFENHPSKGKVTFYMDNVEASEELLDQHESRIAARKAAELKAEAEAAEAEKEATIQKAFDDAGVAKI